MSDFKEKCVEYFGTSDFYEVLKVDKDASVKEIKKAYHRLSLLVHPDRVDESKKLVATEKFKVLGKIHSILQDNEKRKVYDDSGEFDEENDSSFNWMEYWRAMFKPITKEDIENYKTEYIGSDAEVRDIKRAYVAGKGDMDYILEMVPFSNPDTEPSILEAVRKLIDAGDVEEYDGFFNEPKKKKEKRRKKWEAEQREVESMQTDDDELARKIQENQNKRTQAFADLLASFETKAIENGGSSRKSGKRNGKTPAKGRKRVVEEESPLPKRKTRSSKN